MHGAGAAEADHDEIPGIVPALDRDKAQGVDHCGICDLHDSVGNGGHIHPQGIGTLLPDRLPCSFDIKTDLPTQEILRIQSA